MADKTYEQLAREYLNARRDYCEKMLKMLDELKTLTNQQPMAPQMVQSIVRSSGVDFIPGEDSEEYSIRFDEEKFMTVDDYIHETISKINNAWADTYAVVKWAQANAPTKITSEHHGTGFQDFQFAIHERVEKRVDALAKYLPEKNEAKDNWGKARDAYHEAAVFVINPEKAVSIVHDESQERETKAPSR